MKNKSPTLIKGRLPNKIYLKFPTKGFSKQSVYKPQAMFLKTVVRRHPFGLVEETTTISYLVPNNLGELQEIPCNRFMVKPDGD